MYHFAFIFKLLTPMINYKLKLYKGKKYQDGSHPIVVQLIYNRKTSKVSTGYKAKPKEFNDKKGLFKKSFSR